MKRLIPIAGIIVVLVVIGAMCASSVNQIGQNNNQSLALLANINMSEAVKSAMNSNTVMAKGIAFNSGLTNIMLGLVAAVALFIAWKFASALLSGGGSHHGDGPHGSAFVFPWSSTPPRWISLGTDMHTRIDRLPRGSLRATHDRLLEAVIYLEEKMGARQPMINTMTMLPGPRHEQTAIAIQKSDIDWNA